MAKEIISFRIKPEAAANLERLKEELKQTSSEVLNTLIMSSGKLETDSTPKVRIRTIPEEGYECYIREYGNSLEVVNIKSIPFCSMGIKRHAEARRIMEKEGLSYFYFPVDKEMSMALIAVNIEEASIQFQKYYTYDKDEGRYVRTSCPLPQYRYDLINKNVIILEYE